MKVNVLMDKNKDVKVCFWKKKYTLKTSVEPVEGGSITPGGKFNIGTIVEVEAIPNPDYNFHHWEGTGKWSGLGMMTCSTDNPSEFDSYVDTLLANGFTEIRIDLCTWNGGVNVMRTKTAAISAVAKGAKVIWGMNQWNGGVEYPQHPPITAANWEDYRQAMLAGAQWAQDNGIYEFQIGNEAEKEIDGTTMTIPLLITNLKSLATEAKAIFTNGNVSYSCVTTYIPDWISAGKGDLDILASNIYMGGNGTYNDSWKTDITNLVNAFGVDGTYASEFALSWSAIDDYSTDEAVQATAITEMINYIKASGMTRAIAFLYRGHTPTDDLTSNFGILKVDGTYRQLWNSLINSE